MKSIGVTLQRTYLTKNCEKKHCATSSPVAHNLITPRKIANNLEIVTPIPLHTVQINVLLMQINWMIS